MLQNKADIDVIVAQLSRVLKPGQVVRASEYAMEIGRIPTNFLALDLAIGGGFPKGRMSIIAGKESSCKSALAYTLIANVQKEGGLAALIDAEQAFTPSWASVFGIDSDALTISCPETLEDACNIIDALLNTREFGIIVIDSVAALPPNEEREKSFDDSERRAERAKIINRLCRAIGANLQPRVNKTTKKLEHCDTAVVMIQQLRSDPSSPYFVEYIPGGKQQLFQSSLTVFMKGRKWVVETIKQDYEDSSGKVYSVEDKRTVGLDVHWKVEKSKISPAQQEGSFRFFIENTLPSEDGKYFSQGQVLETEELIRIGKLWGIITQAGAWYAIHLDGEDIKVQGEQGVTNVLSEHGRRFVEVLLKRMKEVSDEARQLPGRPILQAVDETVEEPAEIEEELEEGE